MNSCIKLFITSFIILYYNLTTYENQFAYSNLIPVQTKDDDNQSVRISGVLIRNNVEFGMIRGIKF